MLFLLHSFSKWNDDDEFIESEISGKLLKSDTIFIPSPFLPSLFPFPLSLLSCLFSLLPSPPFFLLEMEHLFLMKSCANSMNDRLKPTNQIQPLK